LTSSNYWPLYCLSLDLRLVITTLASSNLWPLHYLSLMLVRGVVPYIVIGYIVNYYCLMFVREVAPDIVIGYIADHYYLTEEPVLCCCCWLYCQPLLFIFLDEKYQVLWYIILLTITVFFPVTWDIIGIDWVSDCCLMPTQQFFS